MMQKQEKLALNHKLIQNSDPNEWEHNFDDSECQFWNAMIHNTKPLSPALFEVR